MNGTTLPIMDYSKRLEAFRKSDQERDAMVAQILRDFEELKTKYDEKCDDYDAEVDSRRVLQKESREMKTLLNAQKQASGSNNFALAILDGDGAIFQDYLYAQGKNGGADAAHQLHTELRNHLRSTYPDSNVSDWSIIVQVVLNMQGLGTKLQMCGSISNPNELVAFGRAFGQAQALFSFVDVGSGKERADHKIRETLRLFLPNAQCKHVFFGPCHDNGYLPVLEPYRLDQATSSRLTLIETTPPTPGFIQLGLKRMSCPRIFRLDNLPTKTLTAASPYQGGAPIRNGSMTASSAPFVPQRTTASSPSPSPAPSAESGASNSWATVGKSGSATKTINIAPKKATNRKHALLNVHDERIDVPLPETDSAAYKRFNERADSGGNFCNNHHLSGDCYSGEYCDYQHGERLSPGEQLVLRTKARGIPCGGRYTCRDVNCYLGHVCKRPDACAYGGKCKFRDTHSIDLEPAKRVYEDGTEEWLPGYLEKYRT